MTHFMIGFDFHSSSDFDNFWNSEWSEFNYWVALKTAICIVDGWF